MHKFKIKRRGFTLIELAMVVIITGILLATILQATDLIHSFKVMGARALTKSSAVNSIPGIVAWFDTTSEKSFDKKEAFDGTPISLWHDVNTQSSPGNDAIQTSNRSQPIYTFESSITNGLPVLRFDGNDFFNLPDGTIPASNYDYTILIVMRTPSTSESYGVIGSGDYDLENGSNMINYRAGGFIENNWQKNTFISPDICVSAGKLQLFTFLYENDEGRSLYVNGNFEGRDSNTDHNGLSTNNTIGKSVVKGIPDMYFKGDIAEIIIFGRAINKEERQMIEKYLMKKWGLTL